MAAPTISPTGAQQISPPNGQMPISAGPQASQVYVTTVTGIANGTSAVTVAAPQVTATSQIIPSLNTVGGTVGALPAIQTITPGTGFTFKATASDTSTYNFLIIG